MFAGDVAVKAAVPRFSGPWARSVSYGKAAFAAFPWPLEPAGQHRREPLLGGEWRRHSQRGVAVDTQALLVQHPHSIRLIEVARHRLHDEGPAFGDVHAIADHVVATRNPD